MLGHCRGRIWSRPIIRNRYWRLAAACGVLLCYAAGENLFNWACLTNGTNPDFRKVLAEILQLIGLVVGPALFVSCVCVAFRHWLLSEKWLLLILGCALLEIPLAWGLHNPYVDEPFRDQVFLSYLYGFSTWFVIGAVLPGAAIVRFHFAYRNKRRPPLSLRRRIICPVSALLLSAILAAAWWKLSYIVC